MNTFNEDHLQIYIDELIDYGLDQSCRPDWIDCEDFTIKLAWILCENQTFHTSPLHDIIQEIQCFDETDFTSKKQKIIAVRRLIEEPEVETEIIGIADIVSSRNQEYYAPFYIPEWKDGEIESSITMIDSSFKCYKNKKKVLNQLLHEYRPRTTKPNGKPLSDKEILSLWDEAFG